MAGLPIDIPNDLYYISQIEFVHTICKEGLLPYDINSNTTQTEKENKSICVCISWDEILNIDNSFHLDQYAIFKINFKWLKNKLIQDDSFDELYDEAIAHNEIQKEEYTQFSWICESFIHANRITYVGTVKRGRDNKDLWNLIEK